MSGRLVPHRIYRLAAEVPAGETSAGEALAELRWNPGWGPWAGADRTTRSLDAAVAWFQALELFRRGAPRAALRELAWVEHQSQGIKQVQNNLGSLLAEYGYPLDALVHFERARALDSGYERAAANRAAVLAQLGPEAELAATLAQELEERPDDPQVRLNAGTFHASHGQLERAEEDYARALALRPDYALAWRNLGYLHAARAEGGERALAAWRSYLALAGDDPAAREVAAAVRALEGSRASE